MSQELQTQRGEFAHTQMSVLSDLLKNQTVLFFEIGRILKLMKVERLYECLGYSTWVSFLTSGDVGLKTSTVYGYISIYEFFIERWGMTPDELVDVPWYKLYTILPKARKLESKEQIQELIGKAEFLSFGDLKIEMTEMNKDSDYKQRMRLVKFFVCEDCGKVKMHLHSGEICSCEEQ